MTEQNRLHSTTQQLKSLKTWNTYLSEVRLSFEKTFSPRLYKTYSLSLSPLVYFVKRSEKSWLDFLEALISDVRMFDFEPYVQNVVLCQLIRISYSNKHINIISLYPIFLNRMYEIENAFTREIFGKYVTTVNALSSEREPSLSVYEYLTSRTGLCSLVLMELLSSRVLISKPLFQ